MISELKVTPSNFFSNSLQSQSIQISSIPGNIERKNTVKIKQSVLFNLI